MDLPYTKNKTMSSKQSHKYTFDKSFFKQINNEESAYWLGFLYADGCLYKKDNKIHQLCIKLSSKDKLHLLKFKNSIKSDHPIKDSIVFKKWKSGKSGYYYNSLLRISSTELFNDLNNHGCIPNKSLILKFPIWIDSNIVNHFIRGYFDGDGSISILKNKQKQINIIGTKNMLKHIQEIFVANNLIKNPVVISKKQNIFFINYGGNNIIKKIGQFLYKNSSIFLDRKKELFDKEVILKPKKYGILNHSFDKTIYNFLNLDTKEIFVGTQYDFKLKFNIPHVSSLISKKRKSSKKWIITYS